MCSAPRLRVKGASSPQVLRERALERSGRSGLRAESRQESPGEGCLVGLGLPGRGRIRSPQHRQVYQPLAGGHQTPWPGFEQIWQEPGRQRGCLGVVLGEADVESMSGWGKENSDRASQPGSVTEQDPGPHCCMCRLPHTRPESSGWGSFPHPVRSPGGLPSAPAAPDQHALGLFTLGARCPPPQLLAALAPGFLGPWEAC